MNLQCLRTQVLRLKYHNSQDVSVLESTRVIPTKDSDLNQRNFTKIVIISNKAILMHKSDAGFDHHCDKTVTITKAQQLVSVQRKKKPR